jgi:GNAT superfamily N-acetyltransferase
MLVGHWATSPSWRRIFSLADTTLARRIERIAAVGQRAFAEASAARFPTLDSAWLDVGGAIAAWLESASPINGTFGVGMSGAVDASTVAALERFFADRGERPTASICPHAHPSALRALGSRGWAPAAFENVLVRPLAPGERFDAGADAVAVCVAHTAEEVGLWAALVANGFAAPEDPTPAELRVARCSADIEGATAFIGYVDGSPAGTGELTIDGEVAYLSTDTTLPQYRRRGVQGALQRARLACALEAGCTTAVTESMPGSASQRNMERLGFTVAYTRVEVCGPALREGQA